MDGDIHMDKDRGNGRRGAEQKKPAPASSPAPSFPWLCRNWIPSAS